MKSRHLYRNTCVDKNALRSNICITFWFQYFLREKKEYMRHWLWFFSVRNIGLTCKHEFWCYGGHIYICDFNHVKFCKSFFTIYINSEEQYLKWSIGMIILSRIYYVFPAGIGCSGWSVLEFLQVYSNLISHLSLCWLVGVSLPYNSEQELSRFSSWHQTKFIVLKNFKYM